METTQINIKNIPLKLKRDFAAEAKRLGINQSLLLEKIWDNYLTNKE